MSDDAQQVKLLLAGLSYPALPQHVSARVDAAIAAEAASRAGNAPANGDTKTAVSWPVLARQAATVREQSKVLRDDAGQLVKLVRETKHTIAVTMDKVAS